MKAPMKAAQTIALAAKGLSQNAIKADTVAEAVGGRAAVMEPKMDGWRVLAEIREDGARLYTRTGNRVDSNWPALVAELEANFPAGTWLDGEAVALTDMGGGAVVADWGVAQSVLGSGAGNGIAMSKYLTYSVFDLIAHGGLDARPLPLRSRRKLLEKVFALNDFSVMRLTPQFDPTEDMHDWLISLGYEGSMIKRLDAPYGSGKRGHGWFKIKATHTIDVVLMGYKPGENGFAGMVGALIFGQHDKDGKLVERGRASGRISMKLRKDITDHQDEYLGRVFEIAHMGRMKDGLRHPVFLRWRDDKLAEEVTIHD